MYRTKELDTLESVYLENKSSLTLVFGQTNIGKTTFVNQFIKDKDSLYLDCLEIIPSIQVDIFKSSVAKHFGVEENKLYFNSLFDILKFISAQDIKKKLVIVLDDFHNLIKSDKNSLKQLLNFWNSFISEKQSEYFHFIITSSIKGSSAQELSLFKKATNILELEELPFDTLYSILPEVEKKDIMYIFSAFGVQPSILKKYDMHKDVLTNIKDLLLDTNSSYFDYGENFIKSNLNEISTYNSILYAIAKGSNKIGDIAKVLDVKSSYLTRYMQKLMDLMIIDKKVPIDDNKQKSKFGRYYITNRLINFWYCYIYPNYTDLKKGNIYPIINQIRKDFSFRIVQYAYKDHILQLIKSNPDKYIGFSPLKIGSWWNNTKDELDIIAYNKTEIVFIACKWKKRETNTITYSNLKVKSNLYDTNLKKNYLIFSKTSQLKNHIN